jgi:hypothetical protein
MSADFDDALREEPVSGTSILTTNRAEIMIGNDRSMTISFDVVKQTVFTDGRRIESQERTIKYSIPAGTAESFTTYHRRSLVPTGNRQKALFLRDFNSLFIEAAKDAGLWSAP